MKHLVVTLNVGGKNVIYDNARASLREAARRWGCDYLEAVSYSGGHHWQEKLRLLEHLPADVRVIYFDGDLIVRRDLPDPLKVVPEGSFGYVPTQHCDRAAGRVHEPMKTWVKDPAVFAKIDLPTHYPNSGMLAFHTTTHRRIFEVANESVARWGFNSRWEIADQGPLAVAIATSGVPIFPLPGIFNRSCCDSWTAGMTFPTYHFCGGCDKDGMIPRTEWEFLGTDRTVPGTSLVRWQDGKPRALMEGPEVPFLLREVSRVQSGKIVEVGSYLGGAMFWIAHAARDFGNDVYAVDSWTGAPDLAADETVYRGFQLNMKDAGLDDYVNVVKKASIEAADGFENGSLDLVYIDGDHRRAATYGDIHAWWPKLRIGGVMIGHDYCQRLNGVIEAVNECFGAPEEVSQGAYPIWKVTKSTAVSPKRRGPEWETKLQGHTAAKEARAVSNTENITPRPQQGRLRAELIRRQQSAPRPAQPTPATRRCGGCQGREIKR